MSLLTVYNLSTYLVLVCRTEPIQIGMYDRSTGQDDTRHWVTAGGGNAGFIPAFTSVNDTLDYVYYDNGAFTITEDRMTDKCICEIQHGFIKNRKS